MNGRRPMVPMVLSAAVAVLVLLGTLQLYLSPDFLVTLADQLWSCF
jgi:hypothetical protein